jgi:hypothetical protein
MSNKQMTAQKVAVLANFNPLSYHSTGETEENNEKYELGKSVRRPRFEQVTPEYTSLLEDFMDIQHVSVTLDL